MGLPYFIICVLRIEKHWQHLLIMDIGRCQGIESNRFLFHIHIDTVLIAVVIDAVLFNPSCIQNTLLLTVWVFNPTFRHGSLFDLLVILPAIPVLLRRSRRLRN
jgi:hypothetical protein